MQPVESEFADSLRWLQPDNPVMLHLGSVMTTKFGFCPSPSVRTGSSDQTA